MKYQKPVSIVVIILLSLSMLSCQTSQELSSIVMPTTFYEDVSNLASRAYYIADLEDQWERLSKSFSAALAEEDRSRLLEKLERVREKLLEYGVEKSLEEVQQESEQKSEPF